MQKLLTAFLSFSFLISISAQNTFQKTYGGSGTDIGYHIIETSDGYLVAGVTDLVGGDQDACLLRLDAGGNVLWQRRYGGANVERFTLVTSGNDGGFLAMGITQSQSQGGSDILLVKIDGNGNTIWSKTIGGSNTEVSPVAGNIMKFPNGYLIAGQQYSINGASGCFFIRLLNDGTVVWHKAYGSNSGNNMGSTYIEGNIIYGGGGVDGDGCMIKLDASTGAVLFAKRFGGNAPETLYNQHPTQDGNLILSQGTRTPSGGVNNTQWVVKMTKDGTVIWSKTYSIPGLNTEGGAIPTPDGGIIITPISAFNPSLGDGHFVKTDADGNVQWAYRYGGSGFDRFFKGIPTADGGYIGVGSSVSGGNEDIFIVKTNSEGLVDGCCKQALSLSVNDFPLTESGQNLNVVDFFLPQPWNMPFNAAALSVNDICLTPQPTQEHVLQLDANQTFDIGGTPYTAPDTVEVLLPGINGCDTLATYILQLAANSITGIVNSYTPVNAFACDSTQLLVGSATDFSAGDKVLIIQMQGATVDLSNSPAFGTVIGYGSAGNYEFNRIESINGNTVQLKYSLTRTYDVTGKVQLIRVPEYVDITAGGLTCKSWDGTSGGVLAIDVANTLTLNGDVDVRAKGFRGGLVENGSNVSSHEIQFFYAQDPRFAAAKGEGIAIIPADQSYGRGRAGNGGGGGNAHNAGGGGGANSGNGGNGGREYYNTPSSPTPGTQGLGGDKAFENSLDRIVMGGGGGAGHSNDHQGTSGGNGGGIIILKAKTVEANNYRVRASGEDITGPGGDQVNDGQGGGGGGGTILADIENVSDFLLCETRGGRGGDCLFYVQSQIIGPGGGGSGGKILVSQVLPTLGVDLTGGLHGIANQNQSNESQNGEQGTLVSGLSLPTDTLLPDLGIDMAIIQPGCTTPGQITVLNESGNLFSLNNGALQTDPVFPGLGPGQYLVTVEDTVNGCIKDSLVVLTLPDTLIKSFVDILLCPNDTVIIAGVAYTQPGFVFDSIPSATGGCDTLVRYEIIRGDNVLVEDTLSICPGDSVLINGAYYGQGDTAVSYLVPASVGCDTLVVIYLEPATPPTLDFGFTFCPGDSVIINGTVYTQPDTVVVLIPATSGCDTVATYILQFQPHPEITKTIGFCPGDSVVIDGIAYAQPGTVVGTIPAVAGCDTVATYILQFLPQPAVNKIIAFCPGDSVTIDGISYSQPGTVNGVIPATIGCDTLATYSLQFLPQPTVSKTIEFCAGDSVSLDGTTYSQPGTVVVMLPASTGCDTIATYTLQYLVPSQPTAIALSCPNDIFVDTDPGQNAVSVLYDLPVASTDCPCPGLSLSLQQGLASGSDFPVGVTDVCYTAEDSCNNSITCCFKVTVENKPACDVKEIACVKYELLSITEDNQQRKTYRIRTTNNCANRLIYMAIQAPDGLPADLPLENSTYTAPSGRTYLVRNPNYSPFFSIRYASVSDSIRNGESDVFKYTLPPQADPTYIHVMVKLEPQIYYEAHLNVFDCVVEYEPDNRPAERKTGEKPFTLFPNPTDGVLFADLSAWEGKSVQLRVYNAQGQLIATQDVLAGPEARAVQLPEGLAGGLYLLEVMPVDEKKQVKRFVIQR